jgi:nitrite reductase/ring-hydroxylating ferredoxin subunit
MRGASAGREPRAERTAVFREVEPVRVRTRASLGAARPDRGAEARDLPTALTISLSIRPLGAAACTSRHRGDIYRMGRNQRQCHLRGQACSAEAVLMDPGRPVLFNAASLLDELQEGGCRRVDLEDGRSLVALRRQGEVRIFLNRCPHRGVELDWVPGVFLAVDGHHLQCATHGALFDPMTGVCISGPCTGEMLQTFDMGR